MWNKAELSADQRALLNKNILDLSGEVNEAMTAYATNAILSLISRGTVPELEIRLSTPGGNAEESLRIYDLLRTYPAKTTARVLGGAHSAGATILQACTKRMCGRYSTLHIHLPMLNWTKIKRFDLSRQRIEKEREELRQLEKQLCAILTSRNDLSLQKIRKIMKDNDPLSAPQAKRFGLIDEIF